MVSKYRAMRALQAKQRDNICEGKTEPRYIIIGLHRGGSRNCGINSIAYCLLPIACGRREAACYVSFFSFSAVSAVMRASMISSNAPLRMASIL